MRVTEICRCSECGVRIAFIAHGDGSAANQYMLGRHSVDCPSLKGEGTWWRPVANLIGVVVIWNEQIDTSIESGSMAM